MDITDKENRQSHIRRLQCDDQKVMSRCRGALTECVTKDQYPSIARLRQYGAVGSECRIKDAMQTLIDNKEIVIPEHLLVCPSTKTSILAPMIKTKIYNTTVKLDDKKIQKEKPRSYDSPLWPEIEAGKKAWRSLINWNKAWRRNGQTV